MVGLALAACSVGAPACSGAGSDRSPQAAEVEAENARTTPPESSEAAPEVRPEVDDMPLQLTLTTPWCDTREHAELELGDGPVAAELAGRRFAVVGMDNWSCEETNVGGSECMDVHMTADGRALSAVTVCVGEPGPPCSSARRVTVTAPQSGAVVGLLVVEWLGTREGRQRLRVGWKDF